MLLKNNFLKRLNNQQLQLIAKVELSVFAYLGLDCIIRIAVYILVGFFGGIALVGAVKDHIPLTISFAIIMSVTFVVGILLFNEAPTIATIVIHLAVTSAAYLFAFLAYINRRSLRSYYARNIASSFKAWDVDWDEQ